MDRKGYSTLDDVGDEPQVRNVETFKPATAAEEIEYLNKILAKMEKCEMKESNKGGKCKLDNATSEVETYKNDTCDSNPLISEARTKDACDRNPLDSENNTNDAYHNNLLNSETSRNDSYINNSLSSEIHANDTCDNLLNSKTLQNDTCTLNPFDSESIIESSSVNINHGNETVEFEENIRNESIDKLEILHIEKCSLNELFDERSSNLNEFELEEYGLTCADDILTQAEHQHSVNTSGHVQNELSTEPSLIMANPSVTDVEGTNFEHNSSTTCSHNIISSIAELEERLESNNSIECVNIEAEAESGNENGSSELSSSTMEATIMPVNCSTVLESGHYSAKDTFDFVSGDDISGSSNLDSVELGDVSSLSNVVLGDIGSLLKNTGTDSNSSEENIATNCETQVDLTIVKSEPLCSNPIEELNLKEFCNDPAEEFNLGEHSIKEEPMDYSPPAPTVSQEEVLLPVQIFKSEADGSDEQIITPNIRYFVEDFKEYSREEVSAALLISQSSLSPTIDMEMFQNLGKTKLTVALSRLEMVIQNPKHLELEDFSVVQLFRNNYGASIQEWKKFFRLKANYSVKRTGKRNLKKQKNDISSDKRNSRKGRKKKEKNLVKGKSSTCNLEAGKINAEVTEECEKEKTESIYESNKVPKTKEPKSIKDKIKEETSQDFDENSSKLESSLKKIKKGTDSKKVMKDHINKKKENDSKKERKDSGNKQKRKETQKVSDSGNTEERSNELTPENKSDEFLMQCEDLSSAPPHTFKDVPEHENIEPGVSHHVDESKENLEKENTEETCGVSQLVDKSKDNPENQNNMKSVVNEYADGSKNNPRNENTEETSGVRQRVDGSCKECFVLLYDAAYDPSYGKMVRNYLKDKALENIFEKSQKELVEKKVCPALFEEESDSDEMVEDFAGFSPVEPNCKVLAPNSDKDSCIDDEVQQQKSLLKEENTKEEMKPRANELLDVSYCKETSKSYMEKKLGKKTDSEIKRRKRRDSEVKLEKGGDLKSEDDVDRRLNKKMKLDHADKDSVTRYASLDKNRYLSENNLHKDKFETDQETEKNNSNKDEVGSGRNIKNCKEEKIPSKDKNPTGSSFSSLSSFRIPKKKLSLTLDHKSQEHNSVLHKRDAPTTPKSAGYSSKKLSSLQNKRRDYKERESSNVRNMKSKERENSSNVRNMKEIKPVPPAYTQPSIVEGWGKMSSSTYYPCVDYHHQSQPQSQGTATCIDYYHQSQTKSQSSACVDYNHQSQPQAAAAAAAGFPNIHARNKPPPHPPPITHHPTYGNQKPQLDTTNPIRMHSSPHMGLVTQPMVARTECSTLPNSKYCAVMNSSITPPLPPLQNLYHNSPKVGQGSGNTQFLPTESSPVMSFSYSSDDESDVTEISKVALPSTQQPSSITHVPAIPNIDVNEASKASCATSVVDVTSNEPNKDATESHEASSISRVKEAPQSSKVHETSCSFSVSDAPSDEVMSKQKQQQQQETHPKVVTELTFSTKEKVESAEGASKDHYQHLDKRQKIKLYEKRKRYYNESRKRYHAEKGDKKKVWYKEYEKRKKEYYHLKIYLYKEKKRETIENILNKTPLETSSHNEIKITESDQKDPQVSEEVASTSENIEISSDTPMEADEIPYSPTASPIDYDEEFYSGIDIQASLLDKTSKKHNVDEKEQQINTFVYSTDKLKEIIMNVMDHLQQSNNKMDDSEDKSADNEDKPKENETLTEETSRSLPLDSMNSNPSDSKSIPLPVKEISVPVSTSLDIPLPVPPPSISSISLPPIVFSKDVPKDSLPPLPFSSQQTLQPSNAASITNKHDRKNKDSSPCLEEISVPKSVSTGVLIPESALSVQDPVVEKSPPQPQSKKFVAALGAQSDILAPPLPPSPPPPSPPSQQGSQKVSGQLLPHSKVFPPLPPSPPPPPPDEITGKITVSVNETSDRLQEQTGTDDMTEVPMDIDSDDNECISYGGNNDEKYAKSESSDKIDEEYSRSECHNNKDGEESSRLEGYDNKDGEEHSELECYDDKDGEEHSELECYDNKDGEEHSELECYDNKDGDEYSRLECYDKGSEEYSKLEFYENKDDEYLSLLSHDHVINDNMSYSPKIDKHNHVTSSCPDVIDGDNGRPAYHDMIRSDNEWSACFDIEKDDRIKSAFHIMSRDDDSIPSICYDSEKDSGISHHLEVGEDADGIEITDSCEGDKEFLSQFGVGEKKSSFEKELNEDCSIDKPNMTLLLKKLMKASRVSSISVVNPQSGCEGFGSRIEETNPESSANHINTFFNPATSNQHEIVHSNPFRGQNTPSPSVLNIDVSKTSLAPLNQGMKSINSKQRRPSSLLNIDVSKITSPPINQEMMEIDSKLRRSSVICKPPAKHDEDEMSLDETRSATLKNEIEIIGMKEPRKNLICVDEILMSVEAADQPSDLQIVFTDLRNDGRNKQNIIRDEVPKYYQKTALAQTLVDKCKDVPLVGLQYVLEVRKPLDMTLDGCYYICAVCSKKMTANTLVAHIKSVPHRLKFSETHCKHIHDKYVSYELKEWTASLVKDFTVDLSEIEKKMGRHKLAVALEKDISSVLKSLKQKISDISHLSQVPEEKPKEQSGPALNSGVPIEKKSSESTTATRAQNLPKNTGAAGLPSKKDIPLPSKPNPKPPGTTEGSMKQNYDKEQEDGDIVLIGVTKDDTEANKFSPNSQGFTKRKYRPGPNTRRRNSSESSTPTQSPKKTFSKSKSPSESKSTSPKRNPLHPSSDKQEKQTKSSRSSPHRKLDRTVHTAGRKRRHSRSPVSPHSRSRSGSRDVRKPRRTRSRSRSRHRSPSRRKENRPRRSPPRRESSEERARRVSRRKLEDFREAETRIKARHKNEQIVYEKTPESHPLYHNEWTKFWERRCRELEKDGIDPFRYDFKSEWARFWHIRMKEIMDKSFKNKRDALLRKLRMEDPDLEEKKKSSQAPSSTWRPDDEKVEKISRIDRSPSPWEQDEGGLAIARNPSPVLGEAVNATENNDASKANNVSTSKFEDDFSVIGTLKLLNEMEDQLGSFGPAIATLLGKAVDCSQKGEDTLELFKDPDNLVLVRYAREKLSSQISAGILGVAALLKTQMAVERSMWLQSQAEKLANEGKYLGLDINGIAKATLGRDTVQIAQYIAQHLLQVGKSNASEADLQNILYAVLAAHTKLLVETSKKNQDDAPVMETKPAAPASVPAMTASNESPAKEMTPTPIEPALEGSKQPLFPSTTLTDKKEIDKEGDNDGGDSVEKMGGLSLLQNAYGADENGKEMENLSLDDLRSLLSNFGSLNAEEKQALTTYLKKLEATDSKKVMKLREEIQKSAKSAAKSSSKSGIKSAKLSIHSQNTNLKTQSTPNTDSNNRGNLQQSTEQLTQGNINRNNIPERSPSQPSDNVNMRPHSMENVNEPGRALQDRYINSSDMEGGSDSRDMMRPSSNLDMPPHNMPSAPGGINEMGRDFGPNYGQKFDNRPIDQPMFEDCHNRSYPQRGFMERNEPDFGMSEPYKPHDRNFDNFGFEPPCGPNNSIPPQNRSRYDKPSEPNNPPWSGFGRGRPPIDDHARLPMDDRGPPLMDDCGRTPMDNRGRPPMDDRGRPPMDNCGRPPMDNCGRPPMDNHGRLPMDNHGRPPMDNHGRPPMDNHGRPPMDDRGFPPQDDMNYNWFGDGPQPLFEHRNFAPRGRPDFPFRGGPRRGHHPNIRQPNREPW